MSGGKFEFDDGGYYIGEWDEGKASGFGVCTGPNNLGKFEGLWNNGIQVSGIYTWPNEMQYRGQWLEGQRHGKGKEFLGKMTYSGELIYGLKHGSGIIRTGKANRPCFEGTWKSGLQDGHGCEIYKEGGYYAGQWKEGERHGYGIRGWAPIDQLMDGAVSVKRLLASTRIAPRETRPATICGADQLYGPGEGDTATENVGVQRTGLNGIAEKPMRKTISNPSALNRQFTLDSVKIDTLEEPFNAEVSNKKSPSKRRSVFQLVKSNFKRQESCDKHDVHVNELYKGAWEGDQRHGPGICVYNDGSRFVGQWKENKRHGYGLYIEQNGEKCGGKWYNDTLVLMTRRKNFKLPMVRKKIKQSVLTAIDAADKATKKMRLAVTRGISARQIGEEADKMAVKATEDATKARELREKYTLHPALEAHLSQLSRQNTVSSMESLPSVRSSPSSPRKRSLFSFLGTGKRSVDHKESFEGNPAAESALFAAMDTTIGAGALDPILSQMVLMQYNDAHTRLAKALTEKSTLADKISGQNGSLLGTSLMPIAVSLKTSRKNGDDDDDSVDGGDCSSRRSSLSMTSNPNSCCSSPGNSPIFGRRGAHKSTWHSLPGLSKLNNFIGSSSPSNKPRRSLLHPEDYSKQRRSGVANTKLHSDASITSEEARFIQMKGKLLTGDEVNFSYIALNTAVEGKDTVVLYTDHPAPQFKSDLSISDKQSINSSTGLYRTLVGGVPRVLNFDAPTGIPSLDSRDSIDSGTAGSDMLESNNTSTTDLPKKHYSSLPNKLDTCAPEDGEKRRRANHKHFHQSFDDSLKTPCVDSIRYSYSPSFDDKDDSGTKASRHIDIVKPADSGKKASPKPADGNRVKVCQRSSSISQVVINQQLTLSQPNALTSNCETQTSRANSPFNKRKGSLTQNAEERKPKSRFANLLRRHFWGSKDSNASIRSMSTDSGFKHSISIEDASQTLNNISPTSASHSPQPPIDEVSGEEQEEHERQDVNKSGQEEFTGVMGTTVVTIENDKYRKLHSVRQSSFKKKTDPNKLSSPDSVFDQNKTIEGSPLLPMRTVHLPTFIDGESDKSNSFDVQQKSDGSFEEYVILDNINNATNATNTKQEITQSPGRAKTWV